MFFLLKRTTTLFSSGIYTDSIRERITPFPVSLIGNMHVCKIVHWSLTQNSEVCQWNNKNRSMGELNKLNLLHTRARSSSIAMMGPANLVQTNAKWHKSWSIEHCVPYAVSTTPASMQLCACSAIIVYKRVQISLNPSSTPQFPKVDLLIPRWNSAPNKNVR